MLKRWQFVWLAVAAVMFCVTVPLYARYHPLPIALWAYFLTRLPIVLLLIYWGLRRRTLTTWIFVSILLGIMLGHDLPALAVSLRVLSQIFLRLIRTIIAPLIFATLVVGIAGHSNLKQVGRLALKSLIYFEIVTTLALAIGLVAINISKAGEGVRLAAPAAETLTAPPESAGEMILRAFPENTAKAIAEGQVLQIVVFSVLFGIGLALVREERRRPLLAPLAPEPGRSLLLAALRALSRLPDANEYPRGKPVRQAARGLAAVGCTRSPLAPDSAAE